MSSIFIIVGATTLVGIVGFSMYSMSSPNISDESKKALANADAYARSELGKPVPTEWLTNKQLPGQSGGKKRETKRTYGIKDTKNYTRQPSTRKCKLKNCK